MKCSVLFGTFEKYNSSFYVFMLNTVEDSFSIKVNFDQCLEYSDAK